MKAYVYIMTNRHNSVLYAGVTSELPERIADHLQKKHKRSFTARYNIDRLVWYKEFDSMANAIKEEKRIKSWTREKKLELVNSTNPNWTDLKGSVIARSGATRQSPY